MDDTEAGKVRWAGEFRSGGVRPLTDEEAAQLRSLARRFKELRKRWNGIAVAGLAAPVASVALAGKEEAWWPIPIAFAGLVAIVYSPLKARDAKKLQRQHESELKDGQAELFTRSVEIRDRHQGANRGTGQGDSLDEQVDGGKGTIDPAPAYFETFHGTGRVLGREGRPPARDEYVRARLVAPPPNRTLGTPMPERMAFVNPRDFVVVSVRDLSPDELAELKGLAAEVSIKKIWWAIPLWLYVMFGIWSHLFGPARNGVLSALYVTLLGPLFLVLLVVLIRSAAAAHRVTKDIRRGEAVSIPQEALALCEADIAGEAEVLPNSGLVWTIQGKPASWRKG